MSEGIPLHGDRSAWNVADYAAEHANDIYNDALLRHLPAPSVTGNIAQDDGTNWVSISLSAAGIVTGSAAANQIAYWSDADTITGGANLTWNGSGPLTIKTGGDANKGIIVKANSVTHTANLIELQNSLGTAMTSFGYDGSIGIGAAPDPSICIRVSRTYNAGTVYGLTFNAARSSAAVAGNIYGVFGFAQAAHVSGTIPYNVGIFGQTQNLSTGSIGASIGVWAAASTSGPSANMYGIYSDAYVTTPGSATTVYGVYFKNTASTGAITTKYGFYYVASSGAGSLTNEYGLYIENVVKGSTLNYAVYTNTGPLRWGDWQETIEVSAPAAPAANAIRLYAVDVSGETLYQAKTSAITGTFAWLERANTWTAAQTIQAAAGTQLTIGPSGKPVALSVDSNGFVSLDGPDDHTILNFIADDAYPALRVAGWAHDDASITLDAYYDGSNWKSSDAGSNFLLGKTSDTFIIWYDSGVAAGSTCSWKNGLTMNTDGAVGIGVTPTAFVHVKGANSSYASVRVQIGSAPSSPNIGDVYGINTRDLCFQASLAMPTSTDAFYFGDPTTDGTWRIVRDGDDLIFQRRESGSYATKYTIED